MARDTMATTSDFTRLWSMGYRRLVPVIPPEVPISPTSSLFSRIGTRQDARGKLPGVRGRDGLWHSYDWTQHDADESDLARWAAMGAGVGIRTGGDGNIVAVDADTLNMDFAAIIKTQADLFFPNAPIRVGNYPKALYLIRLTEPMPYTRLDFGPRDERGNAERVELLTDLKFFVAEGVHQKTGMPYHWPRPLCPADALPAATPATVLAFFAAIAAQLPEAARVVTEGGGADVPDQRVLAGDLAHVRAAVEATPNVSARFPTRESYLDWGYAIKAALPDHPEEAEHLFSDWCARWIEGDNEPGVVAADWRRMKGPYRRGASWLYEVAEQASDGLFTRASTWFDLIPETSSPFDQIEAQHATEETIHYDPTPDEIMKRPEPVFLVDRHIPEESVGILYAAPGAGKSFLALDIGLCLAHGLPNWQGEPIRAGGGEVFYIASEGSSGLRNRMTAWHVTRGLQPAKGRFRVREEAVNFMRPDKVAELLKSIGAQKMVPSLVVVDTLSNAIPGADENLQKDMTLFVDACRKIQMHFRCAVLGVHHTGKSGDIRGSTVLTGGADFIMRLDRKIGSQVGSITMEKQKEIEVGWKYQVAFNKVDLGNGKSSLVVSRVKESVGPNEGKSTGGKQRMLAALAAAWNAGDPWALSSRGPLARRAVIRLMEDFNVKGDEAEKLLNAWMDSGIVREQTFDTRTKRKGLRATYMTYNRDASEDVLG